MYATEKATPEKAVSFSAQNQLGACVGQHAPFTYLTYLPGYRLQPPTPKG